MKIYLRERNGVFDGVKEHFEITENIYEADKVVLWTDVTLAEERIANIAKREGKKVVVVQHGRRAVSDYLPNVKDLSNGMGARELLADRICVWGPMDMRRLIKAGIPKNKIILTGPVITDDIPKRKYKDFVLFIPHHNPRPDTIDINRDIFDKIKKIDHLVVSVSLANRDVRIKRNGKKIGLFQDESKKQLHIKCFVQDANPKRNIAKIKKLLGNIGCVVTTSAGTMEGLAACFDIPILRIKWDMKFRVNGKVNYDLSDAEMITEIKDLDKNIEFCMNNQDYLHKERIHVAIDEMGLDIKDSAKRIVEVIKNV